MAAIMRLLLSISLLSPALAMQMSAVAPASKETGGFWPFTSRSQSNRNRDPDATRVQKLVNDADVSYYGDILVGGQKVRAIIDTGSFELLVFGKNCSLCGENHLYDHNKSKHANVTEFEATHSFGSGTTYSIDARDDFGLEGLAVPSQQFWEVVDADMYILMEGAFQSIFGVGPPASAVKFAEMDKTEVHKEIDELEKNGTKITAEMRKIVKHYDDMVPFMKKSTSVIQHLGLENMSVCFGHKSGSPGYMFWNDHAPREVPNKFLKLDVKGDYYWSAALGAIRFENATVPHGATQKQAKHLGGTIDIGCKDGNCSAVIDTGTSLLVGPQTAVNAVTKLATQWQSAGGTCDDLSKLPDLRFTLNGHDFVLPPESYMGVAEGFLDEEMGSFMPHLHDKQKKMLELRKTTAKGGAGDKDNTMCEPLIMAMDADSQFGQLWILGMPFFRSYYTSFHFNHNVTGPPEADSMSFSVADEKCQPDYRPGWTPKAEEGGSQSGKSSAHALSHKFGPRPATMRVDLSKLRVPRMRKGPSHKTNAKRSNALSAVQFYRI